MICCYYFALWKNLFVVHYMHHKRLYWRSKTSFRIFFQKSFFSLLVPPKCEVIRVTNKKKPTVYKYMLHGIRLKETDSAKYLGINISRDLSWGKNIDHITTKTNNSLNFIKRNIRTNNVRLKESAYKTYVRPLVEYAASV